MASQQSESDFNFTDIRLINACKGLNNSNGGLNISQLKGYLGSSSSDRESLTRELKEYLKGTRLKQYIQPTEEKKRERQKRKKQNSQIVDSQVQESALKKHKAETLKLSPEVLETLAKRASLALAKADYKDIAIECDPKDYHILVDMFIGLCDHKDSCDNTILTQIMETGVIEIGGQAYRLPDINPFRFIDLPKMQNSKNFKKGEFNPWLQVTELRIGQLIGIADLLNGNTLTKDEAHKGIIKGIEYCIRNYIRSTEIAYLLYASGLTCMFLWSDFDYFPLNKKWDGWNETLNYSIPLKSREKWSFLNMFIKSVSVNAFIVKGDAVTVKDDIYNIFTGKLNRLFRTHHPSSFYIDVDYAPSAGDLYTMSYYDRDFVMSNCVLSTILEATYLQDYLHYSPDKLFVRMQSSTRKGDIIQWKSMTSLKDAGAKTTHWASAYQDSEQVLTDLRLVKKDDFKCIKDKLPYKGNENYIAMSVLYFNIALFKKLIRLNIKHIKDLKGRPDWFMSRCNYLFLHLRVMLEHKYAPELKKVPIPMIFGDFKREVLEKESYYPEWYF